VTLAERVAAVRARVERAAAGRPVTLVAVSKTQPADAVRAACAAGLTTFGENYVQEWAGKQAALADLPITWHFVGHLQRNKAKDVAGRVALIHGVNSVELAAALDRRSPGVQDVLVEVNLGGEASKAGVAPAELPALLDGIAALPRVRCRGLMCIPPPGAGRPAFRALAALARAHALPELSMGMSDDFEEAIEEGATIVRVGTALFGPRGSAPRA
jgi:pyridoxal phosphate enzyme (YggS family)